jgi:hypothetical protein
MDMLLSPAPRPAVYASAPSPSDISTALMAAAHSLLDPLARGEAVDTATLRAVMTTALGGSDADDAWDWKTAYDAGEAATVLFWRKFGRGMRGRAGSAAALLAMLTLGDGKVAGKRRQVAGILLDNSLKGRRRAVWITKSDKLIEDAQRDWSALRMERLLVAPVARFRQGTPIRLEQGVLFTTYGTLRTDARDERVSRVRQIVDWLGSDFDGVIVFDESHAMANAAGGKSERGDSAPSQQGRAGLRLQHALPNARSRPHRGPAA